MQGREIEKISVKDFLGGLVKAEWKYYRNKIYEKDELEAVYSFTNKRISNKYFSLALKYQDIVSKDMIFFLCHNIILKYIEKTVIDKEHRDYLILATKKDDDGKYNDDIANIVFRMDKQINDEIDKHKGTYEKIKKR